MEPSWPKMISRSDFNLFLMFFGGPKMLNENMKKSSILQTSLETSFSPNGGHKRLKMRAQNRSKITVGCFLKGEKAKTIKSCYRQHADLVFEV